MEPLQAIAARHVSPALVSTKEEIQAFYDNNAFETLHAARRMTGQFARLLRRSFRAKPEIVTEPERT